MGEMLEYTYVNGNAYGTTKKSVEEARARGKNVILDVDTIGAMKIRALCPDATLVYILPPSWDELKSRLSSTGIYNKEEVNALMEIAEEEISCANSYDYILVNDTISNTLSRFAQIIHSNRYNRAGRICDNRRACAAYGSALQYFEILYRGRNAAVRAGRRESDQKIPQS